MSCTDDMMWRVEELCVSLIDQQGPLAECIEQMVRHILYKLSTFEIINISSEIRDSQLYGGTANLPDLQVGTTTIIIVTGATYITLKVMFPMSDSVLSLSSRV